MNTKSLLIGLAIILIAIGIFKPNLSNIGIDNSDDNTNTLIIEKPSNKELLDECENVRLALMEGSSSSRRTDGQRLANLYMDMSTLVALDGEDEVIKNTEEIRQANRLSGAMLRLNIKGKYPDLAKAAESIVVASIGDDSVLLDSKLRADAVEAFKALAWACQEGAK